MPNSLGPVFFMSAIRLDFLFSISLRVAREAHHGQATAAEGAAASRVAEVEIWRVTVTVDCFKIHEKTF